MTRLAAVPLPSFAMDHRRRLVAACTVQGTETPNQIAAIDRLGSQAGQFG